MLVPGRLLQFILWFTESEVFQSPGIVEDISQNLKFKKVSFYMGVEPKIGVKPQNGWFINNGKPY